MRDPICLYEHPFLTNHLLCSTPPNPLNAKTEEGILILQKQFGSHLAHFSYNYCELRKTIVLNS